MAQEKIQLPQPTGSYCVGMSTHFLRDISRHYNDEKSRPLLVHIYYPSMETQKEYHLLRNYLLNKAVLW